MLVLSRKVGESIVIGGDITITVSSMQGGRVKLCIDAPREHRVLRAEVRGSPRTFAETSRFGGEFAELVGT